MYIKHLMTGHKGNSEFCFPETLIEVEGKQNSLFPDTSRLKNRKSSEKNYLLEAIAYTGCARKIERLPKATCSIEE